MKPRISHWLLLGAMAIGWTCSMAAGTEDYPAKPIRVIVPYPPGGTTDLVMRLVMQDVSQRLKQNIVIINKAGASGGVGTAAGAAAQPDGYTFLAVINAFVFGPLTGSQPFTQSKLTGVSLVVRYPIVLAVGPNQPWHSLGDLIADARRLGPGALSYASSGVAGHSHIASEMLAQEIGVSMIHVPYAGDAPRLSDLMQQRVAFGYFGPPFVAAQVKAGTLRALAVTSETRSPLLPAVPTVAEQGYPQHTANGWIALLAPVGVPAAIQDRMASEIAAVLKNDELRQKIIAQGMEPLGMTPMQTRAFIAKEIAESTPLIDRLGIRNLPQ